MNLSNTDLAVPAANGNSSEIYVAAGANQRAVYVWGTFVANIQVQVSPVATGDVWLDEGTALTAAGSVEITKPCIRVRAVVSGFTSGTPSGAVVYG